MGEPVPAVDGTATQLATMARDLGDVKTSVAVILERTADIKDHETRLRKLEELRARLGAFWAAAIVIGAVLGWLAAYLSGRR